MLLIGLGCLMPITGFGEYNAGVVSLDLDNTSHWQSELNNLKEDEKKIDSLWKSQHLLQKKQTQLKKDLVVLQRDQKHIQDAWHQSMATCDQWLPDVYLMLQSFKHGQLLNLDHQTRFLYQTYASLTIQNLVSEIDRLSALRDQLQKNIEQMQALQQKLTDIQNQLNRKQQRLKKVEAAQKKNKRTFAHPTKAPTMTIQHNASNQIKNHKFKAIYWPTAGTITEKFHGYVAHNHKTLTQGITIAAPAHQSVKAVDRGQVIFHDWLPYYGITVIIDHGQHWYSIYGHLLSSNVEIHQVVEAGSTIGLVGNSGTAERPQLYFALKHHGNMVNPQRYLPKK